MRRRTPLSSDTARRLPLSGERRRLLRNFLPGLLVALAMPVLGQHPSSPTTLAALRDRYRPILLFAASPEDPSLLAQLTWLKDVGVGLDRRDMLVIVIPFNTPSPSPTTLTPADALEARRHFRVAPDEFCLLLLGKDGGEKLRSRKPVSFQKLAAFVDSMPMRQNEMQDPARR